MTVPPIFTIGHSNRELVEFIELLRDHAIDQVVDVRKLPGSSKYPQFDQEAIEAALGEFQITLLRIEALTGRRPVSKTVPFAINAWWQNRSFHNYADHALSTAFREGLRLLLDWSDSRTTAVMCSEAVWWRCHRRIIADHLLAAGKKVSHILGPGQTQPAELSVGAKFEHGKPVTYPAETEPARPSS